MSTKIFDAFRIVSSAEELHGLLSEYQEYVNDAAVELTHEAYTNLLAVHECSLVKKEIGMDSSSPLKNFQKENFSLLTALYYKIMDTEEKIKKSNLNIPQFDFTCEVVIYPFQGQFLLKFFTSQKSYLDILKTNSRFREYDYWDNTDKPNHVSEMEWAQRAEVWDEVTQGMTWAESGYTRQIYTGLKPIMPGKLIELMNKRYPKEKRLEMFAKTILEDRLAADPEWQDKKPYEILNYSASFEAQPLINEIKAQISQFLVEEYTAEMLSTTKKE